MYFQYEPTVKATITLLKCLNVKVNAATVDETLQNHPDWPGLLCIADSLNTWNIPNGSGKIEPYLIDQLPTPFMACTNHREFPISVVTSVSEKSIQYYTKGYTKPTTESKEVFLKNWPGIYLIAEPTEHSGEKNYKLKKQSAFIKSLFPFSLFVVAAVLSFVFLHQLVNNKAFNPLDTTGFYLQYLILLGGIVVTSLLLWYEIDKKNPLLNKVCTGIIKGDCNAILTGKKANVFKGLS